MRRHHALLCLTLALTGCADQHTRECGGGLEIQLEVDPVTLLDDATSVAVTITEGGQERTRVFDVSRFDQNGRSSLVVEFELYAPSRVTASAQLLRDTWIVATGEAERTIPAASSGCSLLALTIDQLPVDTDEDGIGDLQDDCPEVADPDQKDRDFDGVGDECDVCPDTIDPMQYDEDEDGVGDACDNCPVHPNPDQEKDELAIVGQACDVLPLGGFAAATTYTYDGFNQEVEPDQLGLVIGGQWQQKNGAIRQTANQLGRAMLVMSGALDDESNPPWNQLPDAMAIFVGVEVDQDVDLEHGVGISVGVRIDDDGLAGAWDCRWSGVADADTLELTEEPAGTVLADQVAEPRQRVRLSLILRRAVTEGDPSTLECSAVDFVGLDATPFDDTGYVNANIAFHTIDTPAAFDYLMIIYEWYQSAKEEQL